MASIARALGPERVSCLTNVPDPDRAPLGGVRVYRRPRVFARSKVIQGAAAVSTLSEILLRERPQAIQLATTATEGYFGLWLRRWFGLPFVVYAHGNEVLQALATSWPPARRALFTADRILANSHFTASLLREAGVAAERINIVNPGCDVETFKPMARNEELLRRLIGNRPPGPILLSVGGLVPRKGHDIVIRALPIILKRFPRLVYLIVGEGRNRSVLEALIGEVGVRDHVVLTGEITDVPLEQVYALCDLFVMASRARLDKHDVEGFGMVFLEASACGKVVIGGRSGGIADAIIDGETGVLVDPHSPDEIASAVNRLLADPSLMVHMGLQGRDRVIREFTWDRVAAQVQTILCGLKRATWPIDK
jgi:phosphatidylinositol alpha-1,6-mannosyltransferase